MDSDVKRVTHLLVGCQLGRPASLSRPHAPDGVGDSVATFAARGRRFGSVKGQHPVEERDLRGHLHHFTSHGVLGVRAQMLLGNVTTHTPSEQRDADEAYKQNSGGNGSIHCRVFARLSLMRGVISIISLWDLLAYKTLGQHSRP